MSNLDLSLYRSIEALADNDIPNPILRIDFFLHAVITGEECNIEPVTKTEEYLYALATGDESRLGLYGDSISLLEEYLEALRTGDTSNLREPRTREEIILYQAITGEDLGVEPVSRIETYLSMLQNAGGLDYILSTSTNASVIPLTNSTNGKARVQEMCGDTYVNLSQIGEATLTTNKTLTTNLSMIKPSTTYTRIVIVEKNTLSPANSSGMVASIINISADERRIGLGFTGIIQFTFTTPSDLSGYNICEQIRVYAISTEGELAIKDLLLEGDYTNKPIPSSYFEGMKSCGETKDNTIDIRVSNGVNVSQYTIQLPQPLRGLPSGMQDRIVYLDENTIPIAPEGKGLYLEKNVGETRVLGKNIPSDAYVDNTKILYYVLSNFPSDIAPTEDGSIVFVNCNLLPSYPANVITEKNTVGVSSRRGSHRGICIVFDKTKISSREIAQSFLDNNNFLIQYPLKTPTLTKISDVSLKCYENATVYVDSGAVAPTKTVIRYPYSQPALFSL